MDNPWGGLPFKVGERVIEERGRIGNIYSINSVHRGPNGELLDYSVTIRYPWNSPVYGEEYVARKGEFSAVDEAGELVVEY